jgi:hypothetical protein
MNLPDLSAYVGNLLANMPKPAAAPAALITALGATSDDKTSGDFAF